MNQILGTAAGEARTERLRAGDGDVDRINSLPNPPLVPVTKDDVLVRRCRLASDAVDCGFGRFRTEFLEELLRMVQGAPVLVGHRKDTAGIARFFGGDIETLEDVYNPFTEKRERISYIVPKFYWMKNHSEAEDLRLNIDGGIYNQASISWWYGRATCGVCGNDIRACEHVPGRSYNGSRAFYYYDDVKEVLEGSIVFAGGQPYTGFYMNSNRSAGAAGPGKSDRSGRCFLMRGEGELPEEMKARGTLLLEKENGRLLYLVGPETGGAPLLLETRRVSFRGALRRLAGLRPAA